ncbi:hypothetical protein Pelo_17966 [Pelomyxa schiedti]|nr:hypothetical protein Pelo_17966 [Pelomyxa schiedti]
MMMDDHGGGFTKDSVSMCLSGARSAGSSKILKWLITHFQLEREHLTADNNQILFKLISWGQECCAEWLINKFNITFEEVLRIPWDPLRYLFWFDLATWQMIVEVFPAGITATVIKEKFLQLVCHSPVIAQFTLRHFPDVSMEEIAGFCTSYGGFYEKCWLIDSTSLTPPTHLVKEECC